jgi:hypothetical protein
MANANAVSTNVVVFSRQDKFNYCNAVMSKLHE